MSDAQSPGAAAPAQKPQKLMVVGALMIISGLLQYPVACVASTVFVTVVGVVMGILTFWAAGLGAFCGYCGLISYALWGLGAIEILTGILVLALPKPPKILLQIVAALEVASLLIGGLPAAIVGVVNFVLMRDPEVDAWLAEP